MNATPERRQQIALALFDLACFISENDAPLPWSFRFDVYDGKVTNDKGKEYDLNDPVAMALIASMCKGRVEKKVTDNLFYLIKDFGAGVELHWNANRASVCTPVKIGTRIVPAEPAQVIAAKPAREEDVIEWKCPSLLAAAASSVEMPTTPEIEAPTPALLGAGSVLTMEDDIPF